MTQNTSPHLRGVFFDLDGTLFLHEHIHQRVVAEAFTERFHQTVDPDEMRAYIGLTYEDRFQHMLAVRSMDSDPALIEQLSTVAWEKCQQLFATTDRLVPGASDLIRKLAAAGLALAIVSSGDHAYIQNELTKVGLIQYFNHITGCDDVRVRKPHPEPYHVTLEKCGLKPDEVVAFEDSPTGVESASLAGITVIGLLTTFHQEDLMKAAVVIPDYRGLTLQKIQQLIGHET